MTESTIRTLAILVLAQAFFLVAGPMAALAQSEEQLLPANPAMWINSPPLTADALKGKGVVLWFYEEGCPNCRKKWPELYEAAKQFEGEPVVFIAVNSGNPRDEVEQYAKGVNLPWPVIVDESREFEKQWLGGEVSLQNIYELALLLPSGQKQGGNAGDFEGAARRALEGAAWKIDPKTIPAAFKPTWQLVEMGRYAAAAQMLKKGLGTSNPEVKAAAQQVKAFIDQELQSAVGAASQARQEGEAWKAYQQYVSISTTFAGYDLPPEVATAAKELAGDQQVKSQLVAAKTLDTIKKSIPSIRSESAKKRVITRLEQLLKTHAGTDAAAEAQKLLDQANGQGAASNE